MIYGKNSKNRGFFITFEGPEGAGKSTQVAMLLEYFKKNGIPAVTTREPGGTALAEKIREVVKGHSGSEKLHPETELLLMEAARSQHVREFILPQLEKGITVICDRFSDSTCAYQGGARKMDKAVIDYLNDYASNGRKPDLTFLLDLSPEEGFRRISTREKEGFDRFENEKMDFHRMVRQAFLEKAKADPERIVVIDAACERDVIAEKIIQVVNVSLF